MPKEAVGTTKIEVENEYDKAEHLDTFGGDWFEEETYTQNWKDSPEVEQMVVSGDWKPVSEHRKLDNVYEYFGEPLMKEARDVQTGANYKRYIIFSGRFF